MIMKQSRLRVLLTAWLLMSVVVFVLNLIPVLARYRIIGQELADLEFQRLQPSEPKVVQVKDSPWPNATIKMTGQAITELDFENHGPTASFCFSEDGTLPPEHLTLTSGSTSVVDRNNRRQLMTIPHQSDPERQYAAAVSGDGTVLATVGAHTVIRFWDFRTGELIQTVEDDAPTFAAQPDLSEHSQKHTNGLRYSDAGARRIVAAPGGCLFAIGKVDGSVELWSASDQELPDQPDAPVSGGRWKHIPREGKTPPKTFHRIARSQLHQGEVAFLLFTRDCQSLISASAWTVDGIRSIPNSPIPVPGLNRLSEDESTPQVIRTKVPTNTVEWSVPLPGIPNAMALDTFSQDVSPDMPDQFAQLAVAHSSDQVIALNLETGEILKTFQARTGQSSESIKAISFGITDRYEPLWTVATHYNPLNSGLPHSQTMICAWDVHRGRLIAAAELPGQVMSAAWSPWGMQLALTRMIELPQKPRNAVPYLQTPWSQLRPQSPFQFHLWDVKIEHSRATQPTSNTPPPG